MPCSNQECKTERVFARGLCQPCYYRLRRNGTLARKNVINSGKCLVEGCQEHAFAKNLCKLHYDKAQHPLKATWKLLRSRNPAAYPPEWDRFDAFLADVGERPSLRHQLRRHDAALPFSKENARWLPPVGSNKSGYTKEEQAAYGREWMMRKRFGIDGGEYDRMLTEQDGKCAICQQPERRLDRRNGKPKALAVDHDHETGKVRGLLCADCNTALGLFDDDAGMLKSAIAYLERHSNEGEFVA